MTKAVTCLDSGDILVIIGLEHLPLNYNAQKTGWVYVVVSAATVNEPWAVPGYWLCTQTFIDA